jgi:triacylglycerol lipase
MKSSIRPCDAAVLAACAEDMFDDSAKAMPAMDTLISANWKLVGHLSGRNSLFGDERLRGPSIYYGFMAQSIETGDYVVVLRGTEQQVEWFEDAECVMLHGPDGTLVEQGFWSIYSSMLWVGSEPILAIHGIADALLELNRSVTVTVIGHSLGAALAAYLLRDLAKFAKDHAPLVKVQGMMFACPKPGDAHFARQLDIDVGHDNYMVWNYVRDVVPHLPPSLPFGLGFQSLANVTWIKPGDSAVKIQDNVLSNHQAMHYAALLGLNAATNTTGSLV